MTEAKQPVPRVYVAINAITSELAHSGIAKMQVNTTEGYRFRGIDDVMNALAPLLAKHRLCILPRVLESEVSERSWHRDERLIRVCLKVAFDIVSVRDGSRHTIEVSGEALDGSDKATAKALSAAWKQGVLQTFCISSGQADADEVTHRITPGHLEADPVSGWEQWSQDICAMIDSCMTADAVSRVQVTYRDQLRALSRRRPELFARVGSAIAEKRGALSPDLKRTTVVSSTSSKGSTVSAPRGTAVNLVREDVSPVADRGVPMEAGHA